VHRREFRAISSTCQFTANWRARVELAERTRGEARKVMIQQCRALADTASPATVAARLCVLRDAALQAAPQHEGSGSYLLMKVLILRRSLSDRLEGRTAPI